MIKSRSVWTLQKDSVVQRNNLSLSTDTRPMRDKNMWRFQHLVTQVNLFRDNRIFAAGRENTSKCFAAPNHHEKYNGANSIKRKKLHLKQHNLCLYPGCGQHYPSFRADFSLRVACITTPNSVAGKSHFVSIKNQYVWINRTEMKEHRIDIMRAREGKVISHTFVFLENARANSLCIVAHHYATLRLS